MSAGASQQPKCPHCGIIPGLPEWSENVGENETARFWRCVACGHEFETRENLVERQPSGAELAEEFLPNLVVE